MTVAAPRTTGRLRELIDTHHPEQGECLPPLTAELVRSLEPERSARWSIAEVADIVGVTAHTLRYYERIGLVSVARDASRRRAYDREALGRVVFVTRLRRSDMPIQQIEHYLRLVDEGPHTEPQRLAVLEAHRAGIQQRLHDLQAALDVVDYKIATYGGRLGTPLAS
jgi:DNA-binding transcriptional MerR regulator